VGDTASGLGNRLSGGAMELQTASPSVLFQTPAQTSGPPPPTPVEAITMLLAFFGGVSISAGFTQILSLLRVLLEFIGLRSEKPLMDQARLTELEGIDSWTEARFNEEGVDNVQALATAPMHRLVLRTHFTTRRLVDWVDQALLYVHAANWPTELSDASADPRTQSPAAQMDGKTDLFRALRFAGIRTATDLLGAGGWLNEAGFVDLDNALQRQSTLQQALCRILTDHESAFSAAIFTTCQALIESSNWVHVANFRRATRDLLGAQTRAWLESANPPVPLPTLETSPATMSLETTRSNTANGVPHDPTPASLG
jgi:hypothetical protein